MYDYFKSVLDQDRAAVILCNLQHQIIYMNPAAVEAYTKWGGEQLLGKNLLDCHNDASKEGIRRVVAWFLASKEHNIVFTSRNEAKNKDVYMVALRDSEKELIGYYEKHEYRNPETMKRYDLT